MKNGTEPDILAILKVADGQYYLSPKLNAEVIRKYLNPVAEKNYASSGYDCLTEREQQIYRLMVEGHPTKAQRAWPRCFI